MTFAPAQEVFNGLQAMLILHSTNHREGDIYQQTKWSKSMDLSAACKLAPRGGKHTINVAFQIAEEIQYHASVFVDVLKCNWFFPFEIKAYHNCWYAPLQNHNHRYFPGTRTSFVPLTLLAISCKAQIA